MLGYIKNISVDTGVVKITVTTMDLGIVPMLIALNGQPVDVRFTEAQQRLPLGESNGRPLDPNLRNVLADSIEWDGSVTRTEIRR